MRFPDQKTVAAIIQVFRKYPGGTTISEISSKTKMNRNLVAKYLEHLRVSGHLEMKNVGSAKIYSVSERVPVATLINYSWDPVLMLDRDLRILKANKAMLAAMTDDNMEIIGTCIRDSDNTLLQDLNKILRHRIPRAGSSEVEYITTLNGQKRNFRTQLIAVIYEDGSPGTVLIQHDITEKRESDQAITQYFQNREFLHKKAGELSDILSGTDIWKTIGSGIKELYPDTPFLVNSYNPQASSFIIQYFCGRKERDFLSQKIGRDIVGLAVDVPEGYDRRRSFEDIAHGKLVKIPGNLHVASFGRIQKDAVELFDNAFNIGNLYTVGLAVQGIPYGNIILIMRKGANVKHIDILEIYARLAALALKCQILGEKVL